MKCILKGCTNHRWSYWAMCYPHIQQMRLGQLRAAEQKAQQIERKPRKSAGYARDEKCHIPKIPMTQIVRTSPEAFLRPNFASETESKPEVQADRGKECFSEFGIGQGEAPKDVNLTGRATSNQSPFKSISGLRGFPTSVPMWLQRKRKRKRLQMRRYRAKKAKQYAAKHPTLSRDALRAVLQAAATES